MAYNCIASEDVRCIIDKAEKTLCECFEMLMDFRYAKNDIGKSVLKFQPTIAECLSDLMLFYQKLQREKDELISIKNNFDKQTFSDLMKTNAKYSKAISKIIEIGKNMGDAFVWFFYKDSRKELEQHFEHEPTGLYVGGIGGQGELEFVKNCNNIDGLYVIYHSITTMLRIGDFSLFDYEHGIVGVGELKTKNIDNKLQVTATITSKADIQLPVLPEGQNIKFEDRIKDVRKDFPNIERQLGAHEILLNAKESDRSSEQYSSYEYEMFDALVPSSPYSVNSDCSLMILGTWSQYDSLYDILLGEEDFTGCLEGEFQEKVKSLMKPESPYNMLFVGGLNTTVSRLSIPILWWGIDEKMCRDIYFGKLKITTIFNPAKLIQCFIDDGFNVTFDKKLEKFDIYKDIDDCRMGVGHFESICYLVTNSFMKTNDVYLLSKQVNTLFENGEIQPGTKIDMHIRLSNFGKKEIDDN